MFLFIFLTIDFYILIPAVIAQIFNPTAELIIPIGIATKEENTGLKTYPVIVEITMSE